MALSTKTPTARPRAIRLIMLKVKPAKRSRMKVAMIEMGMVRAAIMVNRKLCRKTNKTRVVRVIPIMRLSRTSLTEAVVKMEVSLTICRLSPGQGLLDLIGSFA